MKISINWINRYIKFEKTADNIVKDLTGIGYDIEGYYNQKDTLNNFVIGKVIDKRKHPNADKLSVCIVDVKDKELNIVCGAPNVDIGQTVCVALEGAIIPNGGFEIKRSKIRGEFSEGMICSEKELNLGDDQSGIMVLDDNLISGTPFADHIGYNDIILDIAITANRGDLLSHFGVARELGYLYNSKFEVKDIKLNSKSNESITDYINVEIKNAENCNRYTGLIVKNVKIKSSPDWLKKLLESVGIRSINNIVDITNFVMMECGQPLHAFDYREIKGKKIIVDDFGKKGTFKTLDGKEKNMRPDILMINDAERPVGIAGIMGGENSEIKEDTSIVFIESAFFNPVSIRKSSKYFGLQTDSSYRFERSVDIDIVPWACKRAASLMAEYADGEILNGFIDNYPKKFDNNVIELRSEQLNMIAGFEIEDNEAISILDKIDIKQINISDSKLILEIPNHRKYDLIQEIDLIEEIIRLKGYDNIPISDKANILYDTRDYSNQSWDFERKLKAFLIGRGFKEIISDSIINSEYAKLFDEDFIELVNPLTKEMTVLRPNLITGALEAVRYNLNYKLSSFKLLETGNIFRYKIDDRNYYENIFERRYILLTLAGNYDIETLNGKQRYFNLFDLKGEVQALLEKLNIDNYNINYYNYTGIVTKSIEFIKNDLKIANIFKLNNKITDKFNIDIPVFFCELDITAILEVSKSQKIYNEISKYPPVLRDLSIIVDREVKIKDIESIISELKIKLLKDFKLYDIYIPDSDDKNKRSYTFSLVYTSNEKTLTDEEVNKVQEKIIKNLHNKLNAELRK